jgi:threonine/homoserine/homoserine lactone efflux protein
MLPLKPCWHQNVQLRLVLTGSRMLRAGYLLYLAVRVIGSSFRRTDARGDQPLGSFANKCLFPQGRVVQLTNPKAFLFISVLQPQFIDPRGSHSLQLTMFRAATIVNDTFVLSAYAYFVQQWIPFIRALRFSGWLERAFGAPFFFFGLRLLISNHYFRRLLSNYHL